MTPTYKTILTIFICDYIFWLKRVNHIMYTHMDNDRSFSSIKTYAIKRLVRIFPAYLPISFGVIALYYMMPGLSESGGREFSLLSSLFLLPADNPPALNVAWTLVHELLFYFVFLTFFLSGKFDQFNIEIAYTVIANTLKGFVLQCLGQGREAIGKKAPLDCAPS